MGALNDAVAKWRELAKEIESMGHELIVVYISDATRLIFVDDKPMGSAYGIAKLNEKLEEIVKEKRS